MTRSLGSVTEQRVDELHCTIADLYHETESIEELREAYYDPRLGVRNGGNYRWIIGDEQRYNHHIFRVEAQMTGEFGRKQVALSLAEVLSRRHGRVGVQRLNQARMHLYALGEEDDRALEILRGLTPSWVIGERFYGRRGRFVSLEILKQAAVTAALDKLEQRDSMGVLHSEVTIASAALAVATNSRTLAYQAVEGLSFSTVAATASKLLPDSWKHSLAA